MTGRAQRYVLNLRSGVLHDRRHLSEQCNTDDIETRYYFATRDLDEAKQHLGYRRRCKHCNPKPPVKIANPFPEDESAAAPA